MSEIWKCIDKDALKERKTCLCYWVGNLSITIFAMLSKGGFCLLFIDKVDKIKGIFEWIFWIGMAFLISFYVVWCCIMLYGSIKACQVKKKSLDKDMYTLRQLPIVSTLPKTEEYFLHRILKAKNEIKKIAVTVALKDFVEERNETICNGELDAYIPTYSHVTRETEMSLRSLVSALSLMSKYETDEYYNAKMIMSVGIGIINWNDYEL